MLRRRRPRRKLKTCQGDMTASPYRERANYLELSRAQYRIFFVSSVLFIRSWERQLIYVVAIPGFPMVRIEFPVSNTDSLRQENRTVYSMAKRRKLSVGTCEWPVDFLASSVKVH